MATQDDYIRTALRVPADLHAQIHEAAKSNTRSFNAEIVARLEQTFSPSAASDKALQALALRLAETEFDLRLSQVEMGGYLLDAHFASECMLDAVEVNKHMGLEPPIEADHLAEIQKIHAETTAFIEEQTPETFEKVIIEMQEAKKRLEALKPRRVRRPPRPYKKKAS